MKLLLTAALLTLTAPAFAAWQTASLAPSDIQGELFQGGMHTNAGWSDLTLLPVEYNNAAPTDPWYKPSVAFAVGGAAGGGNTNAAAGVVIDGGPQVVLAVEAGVGAFSAPAKASVAAFFNCAGPATSCASFSTGVLANATLEENGKVATSLHDLGRHPFGQFLGLSLFFGKKPTAAPL